MHLKLPPPHDIPDMKGQSVEQISWTSLKVDRIIRIRTKIFWYWLHVLDPTKKIVHSACFRANGEIRIIGNATVKNELRKNQLMSLKFKTCLGAPETQTVHDDPIQEITILS